VRFEALKISITPAMPQLCAIPPNLRNETTTISDPDYSFEDLSDTSQDLMSATMANALL